MQTKPLVYVIDDEVDICKLVCQELDQYNFETAFFTSGETALQAVKAKTPALCIIDLGLPDMDGLTLVRELFNNQKMGVMILSGRDSLPDKILGLELGADDYIAKPFDLRELVARVKSIVRRLIVAETVSIEKSCAKFSDWSFDTSTLTLTHSNAETYMLSVAEADILQLFLAAPQQILSRERLLSENAMSFDRSIDVRMSRLRKKIEIDHKDPKIIKTVYGAGYMFTPTVEWL
ncbi:response regulator transcription factor [Moritella sp. Urea-trap-13]|uniref:response regulator transcription factor n=1 Tax=Moritella sp. Urea-trap-13 TaxID=2058327 RepID=UPI000C31D252|nr:response regulator transcription factor [Moritella sp. Urea-trap-13]PKH08026.1 DNA-binding response regulator [Moritella sp. Urea-trap-13]